LIAIFLAVALGSCIRACRKSKPPAEVPPTVVESGAGTTAAVVVVSPWKNLTFPTPQTRLLDSNAPGIFQPTGSGRLESALYGSTRTAGQGNQLRSSFHEGIDIAPVERGRAGQPLDPIFAIADGEVAYVSQLPGNSNYGKYVVLIHRDPIGDIYSLYAHLAEIAPGIAAGRAIRAGDRLGTMGNTASSGIPMARAHLHLEIGLINNSRFAQWYRAQKLKPDHGLYNGRNLLAINALDVFRRHAAEGDVAFQAHLAAIPVAFEVVLAARQQPNFFQRYPALWQGTPYAGGPVTLSCSENGLPLAGRNATAEERQRLGSARSLVLKADPAVLGRNGAHIIGQAQGRWILARNGEQWAEVLLY